MLTEVVRSDSGPQSCTGTIIRWHWHSYSLSLLEGGFAPGRLLDREARRQQLDPERTDSALYEYFERWSYEGLYNFELRRDYVAELAKATPLLARHYERTFKYPKARAELFARLGIDIFLRFAAGTFPGESMPQTARIHGIARQVRGSLGELRSALDGGALNDHGARTALNIALLLQRPTAHITLLAERVGSLDYGDESPLFFALRNHHNVRLLLDRGATIDYQNGFGKTALFYAIGFNDRRLVELLLDRGADVNHRYASVTKIVTHR